MPEMHSTPVSSQPAGAQADLLATLFDQMPVGIALYDSDLRLQRCNDTWAKFFGQGAASGSSDGGLGASLLDLTPANQAALAAAAERALAGETVHQEGLRGPGEQVTYWDLVCAPLKMDGQINGLSVVATEATERIQAHRGLEQRVKDRTRELATLLEVSHNTASMLELEPLLGLILDQLRAVVPYEGASVFTLANDVLSLVAYRGPIPQAEALHYSFPLAKAAVNREVVESRTPVIIGDVRGSTPHARAFQAAAGDELLTTFGYLRSWMGVPLIHQDRVIGMLSLDHGRANFYSERHRDLALAFAGQVAAAMENARLYQAEQERREEAERRRAVAEGLRDVLNVLNSNRTLDDILAYLVAQAGRLLGTEAGAIYRLDAKTGLMAIQASQGLPDEYVQEVRLPFGQGAAGLAAMQREPVVFDSMPEELPEELVSDPIRRKHVDWLVSRFGSLIAVPLIIKNEIYGGIVLYHSAAQPISREDVDLAVSLADQAALAIENARLREQAEQAAVAAERSRLARDLHDAVTQTLFSASLIAEVLPRLWERQPAEGMRRLNELRQLTRGALAEMRTLLLELRPSALTEAGLGDLLRQLGEAIMSRARVPVTVRVEGNGVLPPDVQIGLYRIAQEALNNVAKHAGASEAKVHLRFVTPEAVELIITDDGQGFQPGTAPPDHLGLKIMRERAEAIGGAVDISSESGEGTRVEVRWPVNRADEEAEAS